MIRTKEGASTRNLSFTIEPAIPLQIRFAILRQISSRLRSCTFEYTPSARLIFIASERERSTASSRIFVSFTGLVAAGGTGDTSRRSGEAGLKWKGRDARDENHAEPRKRRGLVRGAFAEGEIGKGARGMREFLSNTGGPGWSGGHPGAPAIFKKINNSKDL